MENIDICTLIIKDDFKNVLILQNKVKKGEPESWSILSLKKRVRETEEKCVNRLVKDTLKSIVFDLEKVFEHKFDSNEISAVYVGDLKERIVLDKSYKDSIWVSKNDIQNYNLDDYSKEVLTNYFSIK